ncbi:MAG: hypothetical protein ABJF11_19850 [Reichenbachiella sp.]|uniref:hypothetical protein n=1 Tax=Reichenbachiella sp. TaxID=2184521 RepID=UPI0032663A5C
MKTPVKISLIHAVMGLLAFVIFLQTGWHMSTIQVGELHDSQRMIYRAGHIYFLFSSLLNLSIGVQLQLSPILWKRYIQYIGSVLLLMSPPLFLYGFYTEATAGDIARIFTTLGIFLAFGGTVLHSIVFLVDLIHTNTD